MGTYIDNVSRKLQLENELLRNLEAYYSGNKDPTLTDKIATITAEIVGNDPVRDKILHHCK